MIPLSLILVECITVRGFWQFNKCPDPWSHFGTNCLISSSCLKFVCIPPSVLVTTGLPDKPDLALSILDWTLTILHAAVKSRNIQANYFQNFCFGLCILSVVTFSILSKLLTSMAISCVRVYIWNPKQNRKGWNSHALGMLTYGFLQWLSGCKSWTHKLFQWDCTAATIWSSTLDKIQPAGPRTVQLDPLEQQFFMICYRKPSTLFSLCVWFSTDFISRALEAKVVAIVTFPDLLETSFEITSSGIVFLLLSPLHSLSLPKASLHSDSL